MTTPDDRCSRCDHERFAHGIDGCLVDGGEQLVPCFCPGYYVAPTPPVEPDKPFSLTLTRPDGTTVEVRTRLEWREPLSPIWWVVVRQPEGIRVASVSRGLDTVEAAPCRHTVDDVLALADDLRAIREAMEE